MQRPAERSLGERFGISRGSVRRALDAYVAQATHNAFFRLCLRNLSEARENGIWGQLAQPALNAANALIRDHLLEVRRNLFGD